MRFSLEQFDTAQKSRPDLHVLEKGLPGTFWELNERHDKLWKKYVTKADATDRDPSP